MDTKSHLWVVILWTIGYGLWHAPLSAEELPSIQVQSDREAVESPGDIPLGLSFSGRELAEVPGVGGDVLRAITALPGVAQNEEGSGEVAIRGSRPENNQYIVDFMPSGYLFHFTGDSVIDPQLVKRFDFYPAGFGATYQGNTGGVIDVLTRDPDSQRHASVDISLIDAGFLVEGPKGAKQRGLFAARSSYYDLILKDVIDKDDDQVDLVQLPKFWDYRGKYVIDLAKDKKLRLFLDGASDRFELVLKAGADEVFQDPALAGTFEAGQNYHRVGASLTGKNTYDGRYQIGLSHRISETRNTVGSAGSLLLRVNNTTVKGAYETANLMGHQFTLGSQLEHLQADYDVRLRDPGCTEFEVDCRLADAEQLASVNQLSVNSIKLFLQDRLEIGEHVLGTFGIAANAEDYLEKRHFEPRLRLEYLAEHDLIYSAAWGRYYEFPDFAQVEERFGNPHLDYLQAEHWVIGVEQQREHGWYWKAEAYYKDLQNLVTSDPETRYANFGKGRAQGLEVLLKKALTQRTSGWLSLSYSKAQREDKRTGRRFDFEFDQPLIATLVAKRKLGSRYALSGKLKYHTGAPYTPILGGEPDQQNPGSYRAIYGGINSERLPAYFRLDLRLDYQRHKNGMSYYAELLNASNHKNLSGYDYNADYSQRKDVKQLPVFLYFGIKKTW